ncbi:MAG TPA: hypothetical protein VER98_06300 [Terriglobia bacterium]|nr:hypothetical protein [Terriglobia bacterium]
MSHVRYRHGTTLEPQLLLRVLRLALAVLEIRAGVLEKVEKTINVPDDSELRIFNL